jgi:hypothetical protein
MVTDTLGNMQKRCGNVCLASGRGVVQLKITMSPGGVSYHSGRRFVMSKRLPNAIAALLAGFLALVSVAPGAAQSKQPEGGSVAMPKVGDAAPDFTLNYFDGNDLKPVSLSQYRGKKNVVVAFFIFAFTGG